MTRGDDGQPQACPPTGSTASSHEVKRGLAESFQCPSCGCLKSRVLPRYPRIQAGDGYVRKRVRRCEGCRSEYTTTERVDPPRAA